MIMNDHTMSGQNLPHIHTITEQLFPCSRPGCTTYASNQAELIRHVRSCQTSPESGTKHPSFAAQQVNRFPSQPYRLQTQFEGHSSASSIDGDSDGSSVVMTPDVSRASSLCPYSTSRRQSGVIRTDKGRGRNRTSTADGLDGSIEQFQDELARRTKKMNKEKQNRGQQGACMSRFEDALECYTGWSRHEQSGGNGNGAGLHANKITVLTLQERFNYYALHKFYVEAAREGRLDEWKQEMCALFDDALSPTHQPFDHTYLEGAPVGCDHEAKGKACKVHGHPEWRDCRKSRHRHRFEVNEAADRASYYQRPQRDARAPPSRPTTSSSHRLDAMGRVMTSHGLGNTRHA